VLIRLRYAALSVVVVAFGAGVPAAIATGAVKVGYTQASRPAATPVLPSAAAAPQAGGVPAGSAPQSPPRQLIVPDLFAVLPAGITAAQVSAISGLTGVRAALAVDGDGRRRRGATGELIPDEDAGEHGPGVHPGGAGQPGQQPGTGHGAAAGRHPSHPRGREHDAVHPGERGQ